jgi:aspartate aminotransferase-like enzyme
MLGGTQQQFVTQGIQKKADSPMFRIGSLGVQVQDEKV